MLYKLWCVELIESRKNGIQFGLPTVIYYTENENVDKNGAYTYYGPSTRPFDQTYPSEFITKLSYNSREQYYTFQYTKTLKQGKDATDYCAIEEGGNKVEQMLQELLIILTLIIN